LRPAHRVSADFGRSEEIFDPAVTRRARAPLVASITLKIGVAPLQGETGANAAAIGQVRVEVTGAEGLLAALSFYLIVAFVYFGRALVGHLGSRYIVEGMDPAFHVWAQVWRWRAITHRLTPFFADVIWVPGGYNLGWSNTAPLACWVLMPISAAFGPVTAYNVICLTAPALAATTAFLLCRCVTGTFWPALLGGYIFGFSSYMLGHEKFGHVAMVSIWLVPLAVHLFALGMAGKLKHIHLSFSF
jgi:hypothetical protein